ncbi:glycosyltransferase family 4 protein [Rhabdothermincola sp.]|uniref:glycosyltransferase family 4 protein n=1 Tax=Rhabdothermincola sp. TaxID=2820405 RepID=UPI002FE138EE
MTKRRALEVTILCPHFTPDVAPTGEVMTRIAAELVQRGHRLHVVTSLPWYEHHAVEPGWEGQLVRTERADWGRVSRIHPFPTDKRNIPARAVAFGGFTGFAMAVALGGPRSDVVLAMSPPLTLGLAGWVVSRVHRVPLVFNIQDVFPDVAVELGLLTGRRVIAAARHLERFSYRRSDAVTVLSDDLAENVRAKITQGLHGRAAARQAAKVHVIPNFVDTSWITPGPKENRYRALNGLEGKRVVMYAGNVGLSQSLELLLDAAAAMVDESGVVFVINGGGAARPELERRAQGLPNVRFVDMQPKDRLPEVLAAADVHVVPLKKGLAWSSVPSKLYSILAAGRPIVASVDPGTEVARTVERAGAGLAVPPGDPESFTKAIRRLLDAPDEAAAMGSSGRRFVESWASPAAVAAAYEQLFFGLRAGMPSSGG